MKSLVILTNRFPYPPGEEFLTNEVNELSKFFLDIKVYPTNSQFEVNQQKQVPENVEVISTVQSRSEKFGRVGRLLKLFSDFQALKWLLKEWPIASLFGPKAILKLINWTAIASEMKKNILKSDLLLNKKETVFYSYWLTPSATALAMLKETNPEIKAVSRVHGGDLYLERHHPPYLPNQGRVISILDQTFSISENGKDYLEKHHPNARGKISVSRLGTKNARPFTFSTEKAETLKIVSCSYLKPVKRIHLLVEALKECSIPIEWVHIGDGPERGKIEDQIRGLPENISVQLLGNLSNNEVIGHYQKQPYDLFINVSESEGIPVTIMEAFSFGISVIATDVGGTSELVNHENGYLLPKEFSTSTLAGLLTDFHKLDRESQSQKAKNAYQTWNEHYNAEKNYHQFAEILKGATLNYETTK